MVPCSRELAVRARALHTLRPGSGTESGAIGMTIRLFYLTRQLYGGWVSYTHHLYRSLVMVGYTVRLYTLGPSTRPKPRPFAAGVCCRTLALEDALARVRRADGPSLITALDHHHHTFATPMLQAGAAITIHDPSELQTHSDLRRVLAFATRIIAIRPAMQKFLPRAIYIPHPYVPSHLPADPWTARKKLAVTVARICFDKHTDWLLEANQQLPENQQITIYGFEQRRYGQQHLLTRFPNYIQSQSHFDRHDPHAAVRRCLEHKFLLDMSSIRGDGGGSQYTFLEGADAGCVCVLNRAWLLPGGEMQAGVNCLVVNSAVELTTFLQHHARLRGSNAASHFRPIVTILQQGNSQLLKAHDPNAVAATYIRVLAQQPTREMKGHSGLLI